MALKKKKKKKTSGPGMFVKRMNCKLTCRKGAGTQLTGCNSQIPFFQRISLRFMKIPTRLKTLNKVGLLNSHEQLESVEFIHCFKETKIDKN